MVILSPGLEEEYQACARRREEKEAVLNDTRAEISALIAEVEHSTLRLTELKKDEENAKTVADSHPDTINQLREKIECALKILVSSPDAVATETVGSDTAPASDGAPAPHDVECMDTSQ